MKHIRSKLVLLFIFIMCASSILSFFVSTFFPNNNIKNELKLNQQTIAISILELSQKTDLSIDEIIKMTSNFMHDVSRVENIELMKITDEELKRIQNQEIVFLSRGASPVSTTIVMVDGSYIKISLHPHNNIFRIVASRVGFTLISYIIIGALLITLLGEKAVKRILLLTSATQEVAKGNFNVQIENYSDDEVGQLTKNFNKMTRELKSIEYLRKDFINSVSLLIPIPVSVIFTFIVDPTLYKLTVILLFSFENLIALLKILIQTCCKSSSLPGNFTSLSSILKSIFFLLHSCSSIKMLLLICSSSENIVLLSIIS